MSRRRGIDGFQLATVLPIDLDGFADGPVRDALAQVRNRPLKKLLTTPFFLNLYLALSSNSPRAAVDAGAGGRAGMLREYFRQYVVGDARVRKNTLLFEEKLRELSALAIELYKTQGLHVSRSVLQEKVGEAAVGNLISVGVLTEKAEDFLGFRHQLLHDFLVGFWLADHDKQAWRQANFDAATLNAQSFEALELASEILTQRAGEFIIEVYDWNYVAALDCVLNLDAGMSGHKSPLPAALKDAIFAMNAEKMFDPFQRTRQRAVSRIEGFSSSYGIDYKTTQSIDELVRRVEAKYNPNDSVVTPGMYTQWKALFVSGGDPSLGDMTLLQDAPLLAWTAANVFRRSRGLGTAFIEYVVRLYSALRNTQPNEERARATRWRIMHILGASDEKFAVDLVADVIRDGEEGPWVRYGAVRSLAEMASRSLTSLDAHTLLDKLITAMPTLPPEALREVCDVAVLAENTPDWWACEYGRVLQCGLELAGTDDRQAEVWRGRMIDLTSTRAGSEALVK
jgi:hypothetical protein